MSVRRGPCLTHTHGPRRDRFRYINDYLLPHAATFALTAGLLWRFDRILGVLFAAFVATLFAILAVAAPRRCLPHAGEHSAAMGRLHERLEELVQNLEAVLTTNQASREIDTLRRESEGRYFHAFGRTSRCARRYKALLLPLLAALTWVVMLRCGRLVTRRERTAGQCVAIFLTVTGVLASLGWIVDLIQTDIFDTGHLVQCEALFGDHDNNDDGRGRGGRRRPPPPLPTPPRADGLGLVDVDFAYDGGGRRPVLRGCTLHFERGERTVLLGPVGSGKTTVLRILLGLYVPHRGDAYWDGRWYGGGGGRGVDDLRRSLGYVPQVPVLFDRTVLENVLYGNEDRVDAVATATALIESTGLAAALGVHGVHTRAGKGGLHLSGGQRQLVWCLRVLLQDPPVLIMDEPTASMDADTKDLLLSLLDRLMRGRTVVFVSHDAYLVDHAATRRVHLHHASSSSSSAEDA